MQDLEIASLYAKSNIRDLEEFIWNPHLKGRGMRSWNYPSNNVVPSLKLMNVKKIGVKGVPKSYDINLAIIVPIS